MTRLDREARVTIKALVSRGATNAAVARLLGVSEGSVRYHVTRMAAGRLDGRGTKPFRAATVAEAIEHWRQNRRTERSIWRSCTRGWRPNTPMTAAYGRCSGFGRGITPPRR